MHRELSRSTVGRRQGWSACLLALLVAASSWACGTDPVGSARAVPGTDANPPAPGFDLAGSDDRAIEIADATMAAMGGRAAWDRTRFLAWNFFGFRFHVWDKRTGNVRVEMPGAEGGGPVVVSMNLGTRQGRAWVDGAPVAEPDELATHLQNAYEAWINDSYWVFMPYKLKDTGVTLAYVGEASMNDGRMADVLQLTFRDVGVTPQNKYRVYVARDSGLVEQWDFYAEASDEAPRFQSPWHDWRRFGEILLSGDRGRRKITEFSVLDEVPQSVFQSPEATGLRRPAETPAEP